MKAIYLICLASFAILLPSCASDDLSAVVAANQTKAIHWIKAMKAKDYFDTQAQIDLANAITKGDTNMMQQAIDQGADVNCLGYDDMRPLFWALTKQNLNGLVFLLNHGANPNVVTKHKPFSSPIDIAVCMNNPEYLEQLLKHGANPNLTVGNGAYTAIFSAILYDQVKNIPILIRYGADINWKMSDGETPFLYAVLCSAYEAALVLYNDGANPLIKSNDGYSAIDIIKKFGGNGAISSADKIANKQLLDELRAKGLLNN